MNSYQFTAYFSPNKVVIMEIDKFENTLILNKSKSHIQGNSEINVEALIETKSHNMNFAIGKVNAKDKKEAEALIIKKLK